MTNNSLVVSPQWLLEHLNEEQVVVVDCRFSLADPQLGKQQYQASHIPGAYYLDLNLDLSSPVSEHGGRHPLPNVVELANKLSSIGINSQQTLVVAYDDSRLAFAARLWWLLRYLGHDRVAVLDGGFAGWKQNSYAVCDVVPPARNGSFIPQPLRHLLANATDVKNRKDSPGVVLVDSRERDRYLGISEPIDKVAGHIPAAVNYPWQDVTNANGYLIGISEQISRWQDIANKNEILVYCGSGVTACVNLLSLELAGIGNAKLYAGSWSDWISY
jgi:thiosulfate/3-mercaptopyruvate sulfurtransferase